MKRIYSLFLLLPVFFIACTSVEEKAKKQDDSSNTLKERIDQQIAKDINFYIEVLNDKRFDELVEMISPKMFQTKSKEDYKLDLIKQNIQGIYKQIDLHKIESIGEVLTTGNEHYVQIFCEGDVKLNVSGGALNIIEQVKTELELSYDTSDAFIENDQIIIKNAYFSFIAISKKGSNYLWKFIEVDKQKEPFYNQIIPEEILDRF